MKRRFLYPTLLTVTMAVLAPACVKQLVEPTGGMKAPESFTAETGDAMPTKTTLADDKKTVLWQPNDRIDVFYSGFYVGPYKNRAEEDNPVALFVGNATTFVGATEESGIIKSYWAVYPSLCTSGYGDESKNASDGNSITTYIPHEQTPVAGNFAEGSLVTIAKSKTTALQFYHVCGGIKFCLTHEGIQQVVFQGNNGEALAGKVTVTMDDTGRPKITSVEEPQTSITMLGADGEFFETGTWYYLACAPVELTQGFTLTFRSASETGVYTSTEPVSIKRAVWGTLTDVDDNVVYAPGMNKLYDLAPNEIRYTTSTGAILEIVHPENIDANLVSNTYENGQGLMVFDGPITKIGNLVDSDFNIRASITSFEIPNSVQEIGSYAFSEFSGMRNFRIPNSVKTIQWGAFMRCSSLCSLVLPDSITTIKDQTFYYCYNLTDITLPKNLTTIEREAFIGCQNLCDLVLPDGLVSIGNSAFRTCWSLHYINLPEGLTTIGDYAFGSCNLGGVITIPNSVTSIGVAAFGGDNSISGFKGKFAEGRCLIDNGNLLALATSELPSSYTIPSNVTCIKAGAIGSQIDGELIVPTSVQLMEPDAITANVNTLTIGAGTVIEEGIIGNAYCANFQGPNVSEDGFLLVYDGTVIRAKKDGFGASYTIASGPTRIGNNAFSGTSEVESITIPDSVTSIGDYAFIGCMNLSSITIPNTVKSIGHYAFMSCIFTSITLPTNLKSIGSLALSSFLMTSVTVPCDTPPIIEPIIEGAERKLSFIENFTIYVPANSVETYKTAEGWSRYASYIQAIPES